MNRRPSRRKLISEINITPFTDVILVLLIIFMITTPLIIQSSIKVNLPSAATATPIKNSSQVDITINNEGLVYLDKEFVTRKALKTKVAQAYNSNPDLSVVLYSDRLVRFKDIVSVLDMLNELGIKNLNIAALNE
ncbi:MAG: biopolymer transporter ExbD [Candidatus Omnitrophota bacterium]